MLAAFVAVVCVVLLVNGLGRVGEAGWSIGRGFSTVVMIVAIAYFARMAVREFNEMKRNV